MDTCSIKDCSKPVLGRGWCAMHYRRWRKHGDVEAVKQKQFHGLPLAERLLAWTNKGPYCWEWTGSLNNKGYAQLRVGNMPRLAHRLSWQAFRGEIPPGMCVLHHCDNPKCVRPDHLFLGTHQTNMDDKMAKKRHRFGVSLGIDHGQAKLTEDQVRAIRSSVGSSGDVAKNFGICGRQVRDIRTRKAWSHLT